MRRVALWFFGLAVLLAAVLLLPVRFAWAALCSGWDQARKWLYWLLKETDA